MKEELKNSNAIVNSKFESINSDLSLLTNKIDNNTEINKTKFLE